MQLVMHIGKRIREILDERNRSVVWFSNELSCSRSNAYKIFLMESIDTSLLARISKILDYNFFKELSDELLHEGNPV